MLKIDRKIVSTIKEATTLEDLFPVVQKAIELEHATIPPYLTAMFSIKPETEREIWNIIHSVVIEEMLHMTIISNVLNAIGGAPVINKDDFVPKYPGHLPLGIGGSLIVSLRKYSKDQVKDVFMEIEEPAHPLEIPKLEDSTDDPFTTIGEFYNALIKQLNKLAPEILPGDPSRQVTSSFFSDQELFPILKKEDISKGIEIIVEQGEGTALSPIDFEGELAHYYRFLELYEGFKIVPDSSAPYGYAFGNTAIPFDEKNVYNIFPDTKASLLPVGGEERRNVDDFNTAYYRLLNALHMTFNGSPEKLGQSFGLMYDLKLVGEKLCSTPFPGKEGYFIGPTFEFTNVTEPSPLV